MSELGYIIRVKDLKTNSILLIKQCDNFSSLVQRVNDFLTSMWNKKINIPVEFKIKEATKRDIMKLVTYKKFFIEKGFTNDKPSNIDITFNTSIDATSLILPDRKETNDFFEDMIKFDGKEEVETEDFQEFFKKNMKRTGEKMP